MRAVIVLLTFLLSPVCHGRPAVPDYVTPIDDAHTEMRVVGPGGGEVVLYSESHALVIGQHKYQHWEELPSIKADMLHVRDYLERHRFKVEVHSNLTSENLIATVDSFFRRRATIPDARIVVYIAGHGHSRMPSFRTEGYFVPVDAPRPDRTARPSSSVPAAALSMHLFGAWARMPDPRHVLMVFDFCFSGSFFGRPPAEPVLTDLPRPPVRPNFEPERDIIPPPPDARGLEVDDHIFQATTLSKARLFLSAGSEVETAPKKSVFSVLLRQILDGRRAQQVSNNLDHWTTGTELGHWLVQNTRREYRESENKTTPVFGPLRDPDFERGDIIFARLDLADNKVVRPNPDPFAPVFAAVEARQQAMRALVPTEFRTAWQQQVATDNQAIAALQREIAGVERQINFNATRNPTAMAWHIGRREVLGRDLRTLEAERSQLVQQIETQGERAGAEVGGQWLSATEVAGDEPLPPRVLPPSGEFVQQVQSLISKLSSDVTAERRAARDELGGTFFRNADDRDKILSALMRDFPRKSYRYQLGMAVALAVPEALFRTTQTEVVRDALISARAATRDRTLRAQIDQALARLTTR